MVLGKYFDKLIDRIADRIAERLDKTDKKLLLKIEGTTSEILYVISSHNGIDIKQLEEELGISERGLRSMLKVLEEVGLVKSLTVEKGRKLFFINSDIQPYLVLNKKPYKTQKAKVE